MVSRYVDNNINTYHQLASAILKPGIEPNNRYSATCFKTAFLNPLNEKDRLRFVSWQLILRAILSTFNNPSFLSVKASLRTFNSSFARTFLSVAVI